MKRLLLARHAQAVSNVDDVVSSTPPGRGLSAVVLEQAQALRRSLADVPIDSGFSSRLLRAQETLEHALAPRQTPLEVLPELYEIDFGAFDGGPLPAYRAWAWSTGPDAAPPGDGESRVALALRVAHSLELLLERPEPVILAVGHALPLRYALDGIEGSTPQARMRPVPHATAFSFGAAEVGRGVAALRAWAAAPHFADAA